MYYHYIILNNKKQLINILSNFFNTPSACGGVTGVEKA